jgi:hypothetical protein
MVSSLYLECIDHVPVFRDLFAVSEYLGSFKVSLKEENEI